jgi:outer membrane protein assembly factor BamB
MKTLKMSNANPPKERVDSKAVQVLKPLRTWIPILLLPGMVIARFVPEWIENGPSMIWMSSAFGPFLIGVAILGWWLLLSRASWIERPLGLLGVIGIIVAVIAMSDPTMQGPLTVVMTVPLAIAGFSLGLILFGRLQTRWRTLWAIAFSFLLASISLLVKTDGVWGNFAFNLDWRWAATSEDKLLKERSLNANAGANAVGDLAQVDWPGFRGPNYDSAQRGVQFSQDWNLNPPKELWRIAVGPAWSSFAMAGDYLFTQEQRGESESVVCYDARNGNQVWEHANKSRFFEALGGLGPRGTPTISEGYVYAFGAEGWLVKVRITNGELVWKADIQKIAGREAPPMWGFSASPLVSEGAVIVHAAGKDDKGIIALDKESGAMRWSAPCGENSYGSVQLVTLFNRKHLAILSDLGAHLLDPSTGDSTFNYQWKHQGYRALQPQIVDGDKLLIPTGLGSGTRLIQLTQNDSAIDAKELWTSLDMKSDYNDMVVHKGHAYGFDNAIFACIDMSDGKRKWKGGRYAKGQTLLLADSDLLLVVSESGELVVLRATPDNHQELTKIKALHAKTWNHPIVVKDRLYMRNGEEAVCYQLPTDSFVAKNAQ